MLGKVFVVEGGYIFRYQLELANFNDPEAIESAWQETIAPFAGRILVGV